MLGVLVKFVMGMVWSTHHQSLRFQCQITAQLMLLAAIVVAAVQLTNMAVDCVPDKHDLPTSVVDSLCYTYGLKVADRVAGRENHLNPRGYYTWSSIYFVLLAILTYLPLQYWIWWENNCEAKVTRALNNLEDATDVHSIRRKAELVWQGMETCKRCGYARFMFFTRLLTYVAFDVAMQATNLLLGGGFSSLGRDMLWYALGSSTGAVSPLEAIFPTTGSCRMQIQTPSGDILVSTAVCKLNYSGMLGKVHLGLWVWLTGVNHTITVCLITNALMFHRLGRAALVRELFEFEDERDEQLVVERLHLGSLLFLRQLRLRVNPPIYDGVLELIVEDLLQHQD